MTSPDPVAEAAAYQRHLLDALGDDDPAAAQAETSAVIRDLLAEAGDDLRTIPSPGEWSVLECAAHVVDAELVVSGRYRWILAHDEPELLGYDQDLWVTRLHHRDDDPATLIALFEGCEPRTWTCGGGRRRRPGSGSVCTGSAAPRATS
jgi:hypothetical protein